MKAHHRAVSALAASLKIEWPRNVLRHSFISYRIADVKSADQVALEAGNSPSIIFKRYRELTSEEQAEKWFGIMPKEGQWENTLSCDHPSIPPFSVSVFSTSAFTALRRQRMTILSIFEVTSPCRDGLERV